MKEIFKGYIKKTEKEIEKIWKDSLISFDTNILLNLYQYSPESRNDLLSTIKKQPDRFFLTYHVVLEYHKNRIGYILKKIGELDKSKGELTSVRNKLTSNKLPPHLPVELAQKVGDVFDEIEKLADQSRSFYSKLYKEEDIILTELLNLFEGKLTEAFSTDRLLEIYALGKQRYENSIPPGYKDKKEKPEPDRYGDLVIWMQLIEKAKATKKPIIYVTEDKKEDWFWHIDGKSMKRPDPQLIIEMWNEAKVEFLIYDTGDYVYATKKYLEATVNDRTIEEVKAVSEQENYVNHFLKLFDENHHRRDPILKHQLEYITLQLMLDLGLGLGNESQIENIINQPVKERFEWYSRYESVVAENLNRLASPNPLSDELNIIRVKHIELLDHLKQLTEYIRKNIGEHFIDRNNKIVQVGDLVNVPNYGIGSVMNISSGNPTLIRVMEVNTEDGTVKWDCTATPDELYKVRWKWTT